MAKPHAAVYSAVKTSESQHRQAANPLGKSIDLAPLAFSTKLPVVYMSNLRSEASTCTKSLGRMVLANSQGQRRNVLFCPKAQTECRAETTQRGRDQWAALGHLIPGSAALTPTAARPYQVHGDIANMGKELDKWKNEYREAPSEESCPSKPLPTSGITKGSAGMCGASENKQSNALRCDPGGCQSSYSRSCHP